MEFTGRVFKVFPFRTGTKKDGSAWKSQEFVFEYFEHETDRYSDRVLLKVFNNRVDEFDLHEGETITVDFSHFANEYNGRWYNELRVRKLVKLTTMTQAPQQVQTPVITAPQDGEKVEVEEKNDLPF